MWMGRGQIWSRRAAAMAIVGLAVIASACTSPAQVIPRAKDVPRTTTTLAETTLPPSVTSTSSEPSTTTTVPVVAAPPETLPPPTVPPTVSPTPARQPLPPRLPCADSGRKNREHCSVGGNGDGD
jgi:hypothetical protein